MDTGGDKNKTEKNDKDYCDGSYCIGYDDFQCICI